MTDTMVRGIRVVDTDTHVTEPPDLWTSRVASKWKDDVPHVEVHPEQDLAQPVRGLQVAYRQHQTSSPR